MLLMFDSFGACEVRLFRLVLSSPGALTVNLGSQSVIYRHQAVSPCTHPTAEFT